MKKRSAILAAAALLTILSRCTATASPSRAPAPALPGVSSNALAEARTLDDAAAAAAPETCTWCVERRAKEWSPALGLAAATAAVGLGADPPRHARWDTQNRFDDAIQDGLGADSASTRDAAATASGVLLGLLGAGYAADLYLLRDEYPVEQSLMVGITATTGNLLLTEAAKVSAGRERPYVRGCRNDPGYSHSCNSGRDDNASFFSAHASESATLAGLVCARRLHRATVTWADRLVCAAAAATSVTTGILRISADEHYFTDVLAGWGSGVLFGAVVPLMFPRWSGIGDAEPDHTLGPTTDGRTMGLQYSARF